MAVRDNNIRRFRVTSCEFAGDSETPHHHHHHYKVLPLETLVSVNYLHCLFPKFERFIGKVHVIIRNCLLSVHTKIGELGGGKGSIRHPSCV
jgi:hypothetical protein